MSTEMLELVTDSIHQVQLNLIQDVASDAVLTQQERVFVSIKYASNTLPSDTGLAFRFICVSASI